MYTHNHYQASSQGRAKSTASGPAPPEYLTKQLVVDKAVPCTNCVVGDSEMWWACFLAKSHQINCAYSLPARADSRLQPIHAHTYTHTHTQKREEREREKEEGECMCVHVDGI